MCCWPAYGPIGRGKRDMSDKEQLKDSQKRPSRWLDTRKRLSVLPPVSKISSPHDDTSQLSCCKPAYGVNGWLRRIISHKKVVEFSKKCQGSWLDTWRRFSVLSPVSQKNCLHKPIPFSLVLHKPIPFSLVVEGLHSAPVNEEREIWQSKSNWKTRKIGNAGGWTLESDFPFYHQFANKVFHLPLLLSCGVAGLHLAPVDENREIWETKSN